MENEGKEFWKSKTFWASVVTAVLPVIPPVGTWIAANTEVYSVLLGFVFSTLRIKTKVPVVLSK